MYKPSTGFHPNKSQYHVGNWIRTGVQEVAANCVSVHLRSGEDLGGKSLEELEQVIRPVVRNRLLTLVAQNVAK